MTDYSDRFGGRFLNASHVTKTFVGTVLRVDDVEVEEGKKGKPVMFLDGLERGIVLNSTRYQAMAAITGSRDTDDWVGHKVLVKRGATSFAGKRVDCVELELPPAKKKKADLEADLEDEIPF